MNHSISAGLAARTRRTRAIVSAGLGVALVALGACSSSATGPTTPEDVTFNPSLGIDLATFTELPSGVYIKTETEGEGDPVEEGRVTVSYEARLVSGTVADPGNAPLSFEIGASPRQVIQGFEIGVTGMRLGEERRIIIPSNLAYGSSGSGPIPPNAVLIFRVTLLSIG